MSPEARTRSAASIETRIDVFALGAVLFEVIAKRQFSSTTDITALFLDLIENGGVYQPNFDSCFPKAFRSIVSIATSMQADDRFETAGDFSEACLLALENPGAEIVPRRRPMLDAWRLAELIANCLKTAERLIHKNRAVRDNDKAVVSENTQMAYQQVARMIARIEAYMKHLSLDISLEEFNAPIRDPEECCDSFEGYISRLKSTKVEKFAGMQNAAELPHRLFYAIYERLNCSSSSIATVFHVSFLLFSKLPFDLLQIRKTLIELGCPSLLKDQMYFYVSEMGVTGSSVSYDAIVKNASL